MCSFSFYELRCIIHDKFASIHTFNFLILLSMECNWKRKINKPSIHQYINIYRNIDVNSEKVIYIFQMENNEL